MPVLLDIARDVEAIAPDAWFVNVTNPLTALCRSVTRETAVKTVGLCNEWVGATFNLSLALDCGMQDLDPVLAGVNHFPLATELRVNGEDAFAKLRALMDDPERAATETIWMDPPPLMKWTKVSPAEHWSKLDVIANNAVRFEILRRFGVFPGSGDHHSVEFMPGFVHPGNDYGSGWRVHHYGMEGHRADAVDDVEHYESVRDATDVTRMPSGELVATLLDGIVTGKARSLPVNLPEPRATSRTCPTIRWSRSWASPTVRACAAATTRPRRGSWVSSCAASTWCRSGPSRPRSRATARSCSRR